jgi:hypothetical protein
MIQQFLSSRRPTTKVMVSFNAALFVTFLCCVTLSAQFFTPVVGLEAAAVDAGTDTRSPIKPREYLAGDIIDTMDAHHAAKEEDGGGVREHIDFLNDKYFGKNKLFKGKTHMEAHARKGMRNKMHEKRQAQYKDQKKHATRIRNGDL